MFNGAATASLLIENPYAEDLARLFADANRGRALRESGFVADLASRGQIDSGPAGAHWTAGRIRVRDRGNTVAQGKERWSGGRGRSRTGEAPRLPAGGPPGTSTA